MSGRVRSVFLLFEAAELSLDCAGLRRSLPVSLAGTPPGNTWFFREMYRENLIKRDIHLFHGAGMSVTDVTGEIHAVLSRMAAGYESKDLGELILMVTPGIGGYGTGPDEKVRGIESYKAQIKRDFVQGGHIQLIFSDVDVQSRGTVAWFSADCIYRAAVGGEELSLDGRMTGVCVQEGGRWKIAQIHFSVPASGQSPGQSYPVAG